MSADLAAVLSVRLAVAPIAWSNDDLPGLGGDVSLEQCLQESRKAGFSGTETGGKFPMDPDYLRPRLAKAGLELCSGWWSGELATGTVADEQDRVGKLLDTFAALGAKVVFYGETAGTVQKKRDVPLSHRPQLPRTEFTRYGAKLTQFAEHTAKKGVQLAVHPHMGTVLQSEEEVDLLMKNSGEALKLLVDSGHLVFAGGDPERIIRNHGARVAHVHCKDVRKAVVRKALDEDMSFISSVLQGVFTVPGSGDLDFDTFAVALAQARYNGWAVVEAEQDPTKYPPLQQSRLGFASLSAALQKAGYTIAS